MTASAGNYSPNTLRIRIIVPDIKYQTLMVFRSAETVWAAKQKLLGVPVLKSLQDGVNYGFYCLPSNGKAGKFLDEERQLKEYPLPGPIGVLEFKYKKRVYKTTPPDPVRMKKLHSHSNLKTFMEYVRKGDLEKISMLTNKGFDPNFIDRNTGETPLSLSASLPRPRSVMLVLVSGGAILDYRNAHNLTAVHCAVLLGNRDSLMTLLDLGASPNYKDGQGLTPLYRAVTKDSQAPPQCIQMLLFNRSDIGVVDDNWNTELHQACLNGRVQHLEHLLYYGADANAQNNDGDTPLHVCAKHNQEECARVLLFRGADKTLRNTAVQDASQTAQAAGYTNIADVIRQFTQDEIVLFQELPIYNEKRRGTISAATLRNLQRSRSNPQLNVLFQTDSGDLYDAGSGPVAGLHRSETSSLQQASPVRATASLSGPSYSASNHHQHGQHARSSILSNPDIPQMRQRDSAASNSVPNTRTVVVRRDKKGFGFILRGAKSRSGSQTMLEFNPTADFPSLQYFDSIEKNSQADLAGLRAGDFLLQVGEVSVVKMTHESVVKLIKKTGDTLVLKIARSTTPQPTSDAGSKPGHKSMAASRTNGGTWTRSVLDGLEELERLDATLDKYEVEAKRHEQPLRTSPERQFPISSSARTLVTRPITADGVLVNGAGPCGSTFVTRVELHAAPATTSTIIHEIATQHRTVQAPARLEPEPDYDHQVEEHAADYLQQVPVFEPPAPPPLPQFIGFVPGQEVLRVTRTRSAEPPDPVELEAARQRDEAHAALMAAVQRRRNLLESVDGELIVDSIESRVQRAKMLQTIYRADSGAVRSSRHDEAPPIDDHQPVGLLAVSEDQPAPATNSESNADFSTEAEQARLDYVRRQKGPAPAPPTGNQPPTKPLRNQPPTSSKTTAPNGPILASTVVNGGRGSWTAATPPRPPVVVSEGHNRALASFVNGSSNVDAAAAADARDNHPKSFVRLSDVGESSTEVSVDDATANRHLRVLTDDTGSVLSLSLSTNSSVGVGDGTASPHGSPSQSSSGDSGFAKSSTLVVGDSVKTTGTPILPPPVEFATPSDHSSSSGSSSQSVQTTVAGGELRSVARNLSHSVVFPARTQLSQK